MKYAIIEVEDAINHLLVTCPEENILVIADPVRLDWLRYATALRSMVKEHSTGEDDNELFFQENDKWTQFVDITRPEQIAGKEANTYIVFDYMGLSVEESYTLLLHVITRNWLAHTLYIVHGSYENHYLPYTMEKLAAQKAVDQATSDLIDHMEKIHDELAK